MPDVRKFKVKKAFNLRSLVLVGLLFGIIGTLVLVLGRAAPPPPTVYLTPESGLRKISETFTVEIRENSGTTPVNAVQANLSYPMSLLDFVSIDTTGGAFTVIAESSGGSGQVSIGAGNTTALTGDRLVAKVTFKTRTTGGTAGLSFTSGTALVAGSSNTNILSGLAATGGASFIIDMTAPTVSLGSPASGAVIPRVSGTNVPVAVNASDNVGVTKVEILVNGAVKTTLTSSPYNYAFSVLDLALGSATIQAKAYDQSNNVSTTAATSINVTDTTAPIVSVTAPATGSNLAGTIGITASASDENGGSGISKVEFYIDGALRATDTSLPYAYSWNTTTVTDGAHTIAARAYDSASPANSKQSSNISVTIDNSDKQPPTAPTSLTVSSRAADSITLGWGASTDNTGVSGYRISRNGTVLGTVSALSYTDATVAAQTTYTYSVVALDAKGNLSVPVSVSATSLQYGDLNGSGKVDIFDVSILISNYRKNSSSTDWNNAKVADINKDGKVDIFDVSILLSHFGS